MTPAERLRQHQRSLQKAQRELEREANKLEQQEKKTMMDIKKNAKAGNMVSRHDRPAGHTIHTSSLPCGLLQPWTPTPALLLPSVCGVVQHRKLLRLASVALTLPTTRQCPLLASSLPQNACKILAKDLVRTRRYIQKFTQMRVQLQAVSLRMQTLRSNEQMATAMKGATRVSVEASYRSHLASRPYGGTSTSKHTLTIRLWAR